MILGPHKEPRKLFPCGDSFLYSVLNSFQHYNTYFLLYSVLYSILYFILQLDCLLVTHDDYAITFADEVRF